MLILSLSWLLFGALSCLFTFINAIQLDPTNRDSIVAAVDIVTKNAMAFYIGNQPGQTPGIPIPPYYWWECGALMGLLIQRYSITGDSSYNNLISQAILHQIGDNQDFTPKNQSVDLGNDDQAFWAFAAMDAAELNFPNPPEGQPQWTSLVQSVFNDQTDVWDPATCDGGMRWQIFRYNIGYDYKNVGANGGYFHIAARLARYTGNQTYADYAERMWNWLDKSAIFVKSPDESVIQVWDGIHVVNCSEPTRASFTYNSAMLISGAAYMYNYTNGNATWQGRLQALLNGMDEYFVVASNTPAAPNKQAAINGTILCDPIVEFTPTDNQDQPSFKAYTSRWLAVASQLAPFTEPWISTRIHDSAVGAAGQCLGSAANQQEGTVCGRQWYSTTWDGYSGLGEQMSAMSVFQSLLIGQTKPPLTIASGATSDGDGGAGGYGGDRLTSSPLFTNQWHDPALDKVITIADRAGAGIITVVSVLLACAGTGWIISGD